MYPHPMQVLSPISKLPVELLSEIFTLCALSAGDEIGSENGEDAAPIVHADNLVTTLLLSTVNRRWRQIVLNQANLWSNVCISAQLLDRSIDGEDHGMTSSASMSDRPARLNTNPIIYCLQRSRHYPINIMIDARDENWNFMESNVGDLDYGDTSSPKANILFSSDHMESVISLLVPHISRWKSLTILSDTWAPMHAALNSMNPYITTVGAPQLQWLTLMRCNEFASFSPQFQPRNLKEPAFLSGGSAAPSGSILPRLKHLCLRGVHVDWTSLSDSVSADLTHIDLQCHSLDVRPTVDQFNALLTSTPALRTLVISGSGPELPEDIEDIPHDIVPAHLPALENLTIGYRNAFEGRLFLKVLDAPNTKSFTLEDATYPGDPEEVNGSSLLNYLGSRRSHSDDMRLDAIDAANDSRECVHVTRGSFSKAPPSAMLPLLERVSLKEVKASASSMRTFFGSISRLQHLELAAMPMQAVHALLPCATPGSTASTCPCPQLRSLCIKGSEHLKAQELDYIVGGLAVEREFSGACGLKEVDIHLDAARAASVAAAASPGTTVNLISDDDDSDGDEDDLESMCMDDGEQDPFKPGGVFNDPDFDAYYTLRVSSR